MAKDFLRCSQCGGVMTSGSSFISFFNKDGDTEERCYSCGRALIYERLHNGVRSDYTVNRKELKGLGCMIIYYLENSKDLSSSNPKKEFFTDEVPEDIRLTAMESLNNPLIDKKNSYITLWNDETKELEVIFGKGPESYDDFMERIQDDLLNNNLISYGKIEEESEIDSMPF